MGGLVSKCEAECENCHDIVPSDQFNYFHGLCGHCMRFIKKPTYVDEDGNLDTTKLPAADRIEIIQKANELGLFDKVQVYATDISNNVLEKAPKGVYRYRFNIEYLNNFDKAIKENPYNNKEYDVPYSKYFDINKSKDTINMKPFLQKKPAWLKHDLVFDKNIFNTKFDIIMCRNVLIYFSTQLQNKVLHLFYDCLHKDGYLVLGMQESILGPLLTKFEKTGMVYRKKVI